MKVVKTSAKVMSDLKLESSIEFIRITPQLVAQLALANEECKKQLEPYIKLKDGECLDFIPVDQMELNVPDITLKDVPVVKVFQLVISLYRGIVENRD